MNKQLVIERKKVFVRDLFQGFQDNDESGVVGYNGKLNIRPKYQREFIYKENEEKAVIYSIIDNLPINTIYWVKNEDNTFEVLDGQQRILSICRFLNNEFIIIHGDKSTELDFNNLPSNIKENILNYELFVFEIKGNEEQKLKWFKTINISTKELKDQELRNINYTGDWLTDAKKFFSKKECEAVDLCGENYLHNLDSNRQEYLEVALMWISSYKKYKKIEKYMNENKRNKNSNELKNHFKNVINFMENWFPEFTKKIKNQNKSEYKVLLNGKNWGDIYTLYHKNNSYDRDELYSKVIEYLENEDVTNKAGIFWYLLSNEDKEYESKLNVRSFDKVLTKTQLQIKFKEQNEKCVKCEKRCELGAMHKDHIIPFSKGGKTNYENFQLLCANCNGKKSNK